MALIKCPKCGQTVLSVASVCPKCGHMLLQSPTPQGDAGEYGPCRRCGKIVARKAATCEFCGYPQRRRRRLRWAAAGLLGCAAVAVTTWGVVRRVRGPEPPQRVEPAPPPATTALPESGVVVAAPADSGTVRDSQPPRADTIVVPPPPGRDSAVAPASPQVVTPAPRRISTSTLNRWTLTWANIREGAGSEYAVVRVLQPGERVQVADMARGWWAVYRNGVFEGYVANSLLSDRPLPPDSLPRR